jgi:putative GTP pyrophosphokinase
MASLDFEIEKAAFRAFYQQSGPRLEEGKGAFLTLIRSLVTDAGRTAANLSGRIKDGEESIKKFTRKYQSGVEASGTPYEIKDHITDLIGLRLVCLYEDEVDPIGELVRQEFEVIEVTDKTAQMEGTESEFGYKGLHLDLRLKEPRSTMPEYRHFADLRFELQIRTIVQDSWSTLDHRIKYKKSIPPALKRRINTLAALFELADREFRQIRDSTQVEIERAEAEGVIEAAGNADGGAEVPGFAADAVERWQPAPLNAFRLLRIARHFFPDAELEPGKVDGFTAEVVRHEPTITRGKFNHYLRSTIGLVHRYRNWFLESGRGVAFNPFTEMRHCLYQANPELFSGMLTNVSRESFEAWKATNGEEAGVQDLAPARGGQKRR